MQSTVTASAWTDEDRALMLGYRAYLASLCPGCRHEKATAWHPDNDGWLEVTDRVTCHGCTALARERQEGSNEPVKPVEYLALEDVRDYTKKPLPVIEPSKRR